MRKEEKKRRKKWIWNNKSGWGFQTKDCYDDVHTNDAPDNELQDQRKIICALLYSICASMKLSLSAAHERTMAEFEKSWPVSWWIQWPFINKELCIYASSLIHTDYYSNSTQILNSFFTGAEIYVHIN